MTDTDTPKRPRGRPRKDQSAGGAVYTTTGDPPAPAIPDETTFLRAFAAATEARRIPGVRGIVLVEPHDLAAALGCEVSRASAALRAFPALVRQPSPGRYEMTYAGYLKANGK